MGQVPNEHYERHAEPLAVALVNTYDVTLPQPEHLATPADLERFLEGFGIAVSRPLTGRDLRRACDFRERLRSVFEAGDDDAAVGILNHLLELVEARTALEPSLDGWRLAHRSRRDDPMDALSVAAATELARLIAERGFEDLKICAASPCRDVFVDYSRNGSRRFCGLACANRHRVAAHRRRHRSR
jgi:predicted RNA-binding Zn ribbon-like protein